MSEDTKKQDADETQEMIGKLKELFEDNFLKELFGDNSKMFEGNLPAQWYAHPGYGTCPSCGHCPHCGRGGYVPYRPYYRPYEITWGTPPVSTTMKWSFSNAPDGRF